MSLAFVNAQPWKVISNIIGATTMEQKENIDSINLDLSDEVMKEINAIHENNPSPAP